MSLHGGSGPAGGGGGGGDTQVVVPLVDPIPGTLTDFKCEIAATSHTNFPAAADHLYEWAVSITEGFYASLGGDWQLIAGVPVAPAFPIYIAISERQDINVTGTGSVQQIGPTVKIKNSNGFGQYLFGQNTGGQFLYLNYQFDSFTAVGDGSITGQVSSDNATWVDHIALVINNAQVYDDTTPSYAANAFLSGLGTADTLYFRIVCDIPSASPLKLKQLKLSSY